MSVTLVKKKSSVRPDRRRLPANMGIQRPTEKLNTVEERDEDVPEAAKRSSTEFVIVDSDAESIMVELEESKSENDAELRESANSINDFISLRDVD